MRGKTLTAIVASAAALTLAAACGHQEGTPVLPISQPLPSPVVLEPIPQAPGISVPVKGVCDSPGKSPYVTFTAELAKGNIVERKEIPFNVSSGLENFFPHYKNPANKANFVCDGVAVNGEYIIVIGRDGKDSNLPFSITYVFYAAPFEGTDGQYSPGVGFVGMAPNYGHQKSEIAIVRSIGSRSYHDVLLMPALINGGSSVNVGMLKNNVSALGHSNFNYGAKLSAFALLQPFIKYEPNVPLSNVTLQEIAARPVAFGTDVQLEKLVVGGLNGQGYVTVTASEDVGGGRHILGSETTPLSGNEGFITGGLQPDKQLVVNTRLTK